MTLSRARDRSLKCERRREAGGSTVQLYMVQRGAASAGAEERGACVQTLALRAGSMGRRWSSRVSCMIFRDARVRQCVWLHDSCRVHLCTVPTQYGKRHATDSSPIRCTHMSDVGTQLYLLTYKPKTKVVVWFALVCLGSLPHVPRPRRPCFRPLRVTKCDTHSLYVCSCVHTGYSCTK